MRRLLVGLLVIAGCHKASRSGGSPKDADALWALAPEGTQVAVVATPRAIAMIEHGWQDVHAFVEKAPEMKPIAEMMDEQLKTLTGVPDLRLADYGLTSEKGGALFVVGPEQVLLVVPVAARDTFLAKAGGTKGADEDHIKKATCKTVQGVYACASDPALFAKLGKSKLRDKLDVRGDIEIVAEGVPGMPMKSVAAVVQLERGAAVVRGTLVGLPISATAQLGAPIKPVVDREHSSGFGVVNLGAFLSQMPEVPLGAGVTTTQLAHSLAGPLTLSVAAGSLAFDLRIALSDPAPAQTLIDHCGELVPGASAKDGTCHMAIPQVNIALDAWIENKTLRLGMKNAPAGKAIAMTPIGAELAEGSWNFAFWGRGSMLAIPQLPFPADAAQDPQAQIGLRAFAMVNELGIGVRVDGDALKLVGTARTAWSNPDDVVGKLAVMNPLDVLAGKGSAVAQGLPSSAPLARDVEAGYSGLLLPVALVGMASAVAIPAYFDYMNKSKKVPAMVELNRLGKNLKTYYVTTSAFPVGDAKLTPAAPCCQKPHATCPADPKDWASGPWKELDFELSEPSLFQYSYHSDGKTVEIDAVGDLDCDGTAITYRLEADAVGGTPRVTIEEPPPNTD